MQKIISTIVLLFVLSFSIIADDGHTNTGGGKSCPQGQTTCFVNPDDQTSPETKPFYKSFFDFLTNIFLKSK